MLLLKVRLDERKYFSAFLFCSEVGHCLASSIIQSQSLIMNEMTNLCDESKNTSGEEARQNDAFGTEIFRKVDTAEKAHFGALEQLLGSFSDLIPQYITVKETANGNLNIIMIFFVSAG